MTTESLNPSAEVNPLGSDLATVETPVCKCGKASVPRPAYPDTTFAWICHCGQDAAWVCAEAACGFGTCARHATPGSAGPTKQPTVAEEKSEPIPAAPAQPHPNLCRKCSCAILPDGNCVNCRPRIVGVYAAETKGSAGCKYCSGPRGQSSDPLVCEACIFARMSQFADNRPRFLSQREGTAFEVAVGGVFGKLPPVHDRRSCLCESCVERRNKRFGQADLDGLEDA